MPVLLSPLRRTAPLSFARIPHESGSARKVAGLVAYPAETVPLLRPRNNSRFGEKFSCSG